MIEVHLAYDVKPDIDEQAYFEWMKKEIVGLFKRQRAVEVRAYHNTKESPGVLVVALLEKQEEWMKFSQSEEWHSLLNTLRSIFATNLRIEDWEPSPFIPTPLRSHK